MEDEWIDTYLELDCFFFAVIKHRRGKERRGETNRKGHQALGWKSFLPSLPGSSGDYSKLKYMFMFIEGPKGEVMDERMNHIVR